MYDLCLNKSEKKRKRSFSFVGKLFRRTRKPRAHFRLLADFITLLEYKLKVFELIFDVGDRTVGGTDCEPLVGDKRPPGDVAVPVGVELIFTDNRLAS